MFNRINELCRGVTISSLESIKSLDDLAQGLRTGRMQPDEVEPIRLVEREGTLIILDNRRLQAFRQADMGIPTRRATLEELTRAERTGEFSAGAGGTEAIKIRRRSV